MISFVTPTFGRPHLLPCLYDIFRNQTCADKELVILDDSPEPCSFMQRLSDDRVQYIHAPHRLPIGAKRDTLAARARGDVIVHLDDDDYYSPEYGATVSKALQQCEFVKLVGWFSFHVATRGLFYWDALSIAPVHYRVSGDSCLATNVGPLNDRERSEWLLSQGWGYGFSYAFRKELYGRARFRWQDGYGEDYRFFEAVWRSGARINGMIDHRGLALHVIHEANNSFILPNFRLPSQFLETFFGDGARAFLAGAHGVSLAPVVTLQEFQSSRLNK